MDYGLTGRTALVGGASSGLGRASAAALAAEGCRLAIWSREPGRARGRGRRPPRTARDRHRRPRRRRRAAGYRGPDRRRGTGRSRHDRYPRPQRRWAADGRPDRDRRSRLAARLPAPVDHPDRAGDRAPARDARAWLGPDRRNPVVGCPPADRRPRLLERRPRRPDGLARRRPPGPSPRTGSRSTACCPVASRRRGSTASIAVGRSGPGSHSRPSGPPTWRTIPAGRYGRPEELAACVAYLCSDGAGYQTGTFTAVDGGLLSGLP